ncbi:MAG: adenylyl-sulfate kinase [Polyangiaceae bacterium]
MRGVIVWLTGLSGAGKSTLAARLAERLVARGLAVEVLDGDEMRKHLCKGLGYTREDRDTNVRRIGWVAHLLERNGVVAIVAAISPYRESRDWVRGLSAAFLEVHVSAPLAVCESRDPKGLYARARTGELPLFTGISDPYEAPEAPELVLETDRFDAEHCVDLLERALDSRRRSPS